MPGTVTMGGQTVRRLSPNETNENHCNRQCFNCDKKYVRAHNRVYAKLFHLELHDVDEENDPMSHWNSRTSH